MSSNVNFQWDGICSEEGWLHGSYSYFYIFKINCKSLDCGDFKTIQNDAFKRAKQLRGRRFFRGMSRYLIVPVMIIRDDLLVEEVVGHPRCRLFFYAVKFFPIVISESGRVLYKEAAQGDTVVVYRYVSKMMDKGIALIKGDLMNG